jgi:hypothetical protein
VKDKKNPRFRAGCLGGYKSGNKIIADSDTKNNAPEIILADKSGAFSRNTTAIIPAMAKGSALKQINFGET